MRPCRKVAPSNCAPIVHPRGNCGGSGAPLPRLGESAGVRGALHHREAIVTSTGNPYLKGVI